LSATSDERRAIAAGGLAAAALVAHQVAGRATRDALFLSHFPVDSLPIAISVAAAVSITGVLVFSRVLLRYSPARAVPAALVVAASFLLVQWSLAGRYPRAAAVALYLHLAFFGATLISGFWSLVNERFDPHAAKRAVARIGAGASLGGVAGGALAAGASSFLPVDAMLLLMAGLNLAALGALLPLHPERREGPHEAPTTDSGLTMLRTIPYLRLLALMVALGALAEALLDYVLSARAVAALGRGRPLLSFFAFFHTGVAIAGLAVQALLSRRTLERLGLAGTIAVQPAGVAATVALSLVWPGLWTAVVVRGVEAVVHGSLFRSGYELLYTPLPLDRKRAMKALVDVGFDKVGAAAGGLLTMGLVALAPAAAPPLALVAAALAATATLSLLPRLHRGYVVSLEESLRTGAVRLERDDVMDGTTRYTMARTGLALDRDTLMREIAALRQTERSTPADDAVSASVAILRGGDAVAIRAVLAEGLPVALVGHAIPLLADDALAAEAVRALRRIAPGIAGQLVDALLDPLRPDAVRRRVPRVLRGASGPISVLGLRLGLDDRRFDVRYQCGRALAAILDQAPGLAPARDVVFEEVKREVARGLAGDDRRLEHVFTLLALVVPREPVQIAYRAVRSQDRALRGTALEYLENVLPDDVRGVLWPHLDAGAREAPRRAPDEVVADLLRSSDQLPTPAPRRRRSSG
jgi:ATP:ADP antiporter, AAA family